MQPITFYKHNPERVINVYARAAGSIIAVVNYMASRDPYDIELFYEDRLFVRQVTGEVTPGGIRLPAGQANLCALKYTRLSEEADKMAVVQIAK